MSWGSSRRRFNFTRSNECLRRCFRFWYSYRNPLTFLSQNREKSLQIKNKKWEDKHIESYSTVRFERIYALTATESRCSRLHSSLAVFMNHIQLSPGQWQHRISYSHIHPVLHLGDVRERNQTIIPCSLPSPLPAVTCKLIYVSSWILRVI